jgi:anti-sigma regulatory factor (Ser/Thr protein kinase)
MKELSLHILDIAENSVSANAKTVSIEVEEDSQNNLLTIIITDDGKGMDAEMLARVTDPFTTTRTTRKVGLGIPFFKEAAETCNGHFAIASTPGKGTRVEASFQRDHIDRMPMGSIQTTFLDLLVGFPDIHWKFKYRIDEEEFDFDSEPVRKTLDGIPYSDPTVLKYLKDEIDFGIQKIQSVHKQEMP